MRLLRFGLPAAFALSLFAMGCGGGSFIDSDRSNGLSGTWTLDSISNGTTSATCPGTLDLTGYSVGCSRTTIIYTKDGKFTQTSADGSTVLTGTFNYDGRNLTTHYGSTDETFTVPLTTTSGNPNVFSYTLRESGQPVTYNWVRTTAG